MDCIQDDCHSDSIWKFFNSVLSIYFGQSRGKSQQQLSTVINIMYNAALLFTSSVTPHNTENQSYIWRVWFQNALTAKIKKNWVITSII